MKLISEMIHKQAGQFRSSINIFTLKFSSKILNHLFSDYKDEIFNSSIVFYIFIVSKIVHLIIRVIMLILSYYIPNNTCTVSFWGEILLLIITGSTDILEIFFIFVKRLNDLRGVPTQLICMILFFLNSYLNFFSRNNYEIIIDFSLIIYIFGAVFVGFFVSKNSFFVHISYIFLGIGTLVFYFSLYKILVFNAIWNVTCIIFVYSGIILLNYILDYNYKKYFFIIYKNSIEIRDWKKFIHFFPVGILISLNGTIKFMNKAFAQIMGMKEANNKKLIDFEQNNNITEEVLSKINYFKNEDNLDENFLTIIKNSDYNDKLNYSLIRNTERKEKYYELYKSEIPLENNKFWAFLIKDETSVNMLNKELQAKQKFKEKYFASVSHDMRNPISSIITALKSVIELINNNTVFDAISTSISCAELLLCSVNDILDIGQLENNKFKLVLANINISEVVKDCIIVMSVNYREKGITLNSYYSPDLPIVIKSDKTRVKGVLLNLLSNALKFTRKGRVDVSVKNTRNNERIKIIVKDTGKGIAKEDFSKLFQMYGKLGGNEVENPNGVGIGLSFSKKISQLLGGDIQFNSIKNLGSKFVFWISKNPENIKNEENRSLPIEFTEVSDTSIERVNLNGSNNIENIVSGQRILDSNKSPSLNENTECTLYHTQCLCPQVLIVDDMDFIHSALKKQLSNLGIKAIDCYSGEEAIEYMKNYSPKNCCRGIRLIFMDINMEPGINGFESTKILKSLMEKGEIPKVYIVGLSGDNIGVGNMDEIMLKPISKEKLIGILNKSLFLFSN